MLVKDFINAINPAEVVGLVLLEDWLCKGPTFYKVAEVPRRYWNTTINRKWHEWDDILGCYVWFIEYGYNFDFLNMEE